MRPPKVSRPCTSSQAPRPITTRPPSSSTKSTVGPYSAPILVEAIAAWYRPMLSRWNRACSQSCLL